jgi:hypothetical protein
MSTLRLDDEPTLTGVRHKFNTMTHHTHLVQTRLTIEQDKADDICQDPGEPSLLKSLTLHL